VTGSWTESSGWADYCTFHHWQLKTGDVDPVYPVLREVGELLDLDGEARLWLTFLHVAYYHLGSALAAFEATGGKVAMPPADLVLPTGTERRAHRDHRQLRAHMRSLVDTIDSYGGVIAWLGGAAYGTGSSQDRWSAVSSAVTRVHGNGRWAAFKTGEMLAAVNGLPLAAPDMGHANSSGPRHGLACLYPDVPTGNQPDTLAALDKLSLAHLAALHEAGLPGTLETAETTLCDWHAVTEGRYYIGHDIDQMLDQLRKSPTRLDGVALIARGRSFEPHLLGEVSGWPGVRKPLNRLYRDTGRLLWWLDGVSAA
jgi:hypothetical protein